MWSSDRSLNEIDEVIHRIDDKEYEEMKDNVSIISKKLKNGEYTKKCILECLEKIE